MNDAIDQMLGRYACQTRNDYVNALREILQQLALLGLWRAKFFEGAAFYGGTALRVLYGLDRFSEDLDFSRLTPDPAFSLAPFCGAIRRELESFGFEVSARIRAAYVRQRETDFDGLALRQTCEPDIHAFHVASIGRAVRLDLLPFIMRLERLAELRHEIHV